MGRRIFSGGADGRVVEWFADGQGIQIARMESPVFCLTALSHQWLAVGTQSGECLVLDLNAKALLFRINCSRKGVYVLHQQGNDGCFLAGDGDGRAHLISLADRAIVSGWEVSAGKALRSAVFMQLENAWAIGSADFTIKQFSVKGEQLAVMQGHQGSVFGLAWSQHHPRWLFSVSKDVHLHRYTLGNEEPDYRIPAHLLHIHAVSISPEGKWLATGSMDKTIKLWDPESMELKKVMDKARNNAHTSSVNALAWISESEFVSASDDRDCKQFQLEA